LPVSTSPQRADAILLTRRPAGALTTLVGIDDDRQFTAFGAAGALLFMVLSGSAASGDD
jgi:hypothetical protein